MKFSLILCLIGSTVALAQVSHRPIEDFTSAQVNVTGWDNSNNPMFVGVIDIGGVVNRFLVANNCGPDLGTTFSGDIMETALPDGRTQVHVVLHGNNAFMRAFLEADGTPVLGFTRAEVCFAGAPPVLGSFLVTADFINNQGLGGPLPDLFAVLTAPDPGQVFQGILVNASAEGPLRFLPGVQPGTPGFMKVLQRGPYVRGNGVPGHDTFPAELVNVKASGQ